MAAPYWTAALSSVSSNHGLNSDSPLYKDFQKIFKHINPEDGYLRIYWNLGKTSAFNGGYSRNIKSCNKEESRLFCNLSYTSSASFLFFSSVSFIFLFFFFFTFLQVYFYASTPFSSRIVVFWCSDRHNCASSVWKRCYTAILKWAHFPIFAVRTHFLLQNEAIKLLRYFQQTT
jgi:hypothetical protein